MWIVEEGDQSSISPQIQPLSAPCKNRPRSMLIYLFPAIGPQGLGFLFSFVLRCIVEMWAVRLATRHIVICPFPERMT